MADTIRDRLLAHGNKYEFAYLLMKQATDYIDKLEAHNLRLDAELDTVYDGAIEDAAKAAKSVGLTKQVFYWRGQVDDAIRALKQPSVSDTPKETGK